MESLDQIILLGIIAIPFFSVWNDYMTQTASIISGVVKDNDGNAISGARVSFIAGPVPLPDIAALTDINGTFVLSALYQETILLKLFQRNLSRRR
jgi:hypothetical protein